MAAGGSSFAAGRLAYANHLGSVVWGGYTGSVFSSTADNQFLIRASGGVGIGTNAPEGNLHVVHGSAGTITANSEAPVVVESDVNAYLNILAPDAKETGILFGRPGSSVPNAAGGIIFNHTGNGDGLLFRTGGNTTRMTIDSTGKVGIGRTPTANVLEISGNDASKGIAGSWVANSDRRIKKNIETIGSALDTLDDVRLVTFEYTDAYRAEHPSIQPHRYMNVIAQEFAEVFPDHVKGSGDKVPGTDEEILQVDTYPLTIYSAAAIQELHQLVKAQQAEIDGLNSRMAALEHTLSVNVQSHPVSLASHGVFAMPALALLGFVGLIVRGRAQNRGGL